MDETEKYIWQKRRKTMKVIIEHKNKVVEFYDVPAEVANSIESLLHAIEAEKSNIISVESELDRKEN